MELVFPVLLFLASWVHEKERKNNKVGVIERKPLKSTNSFAYLQVILRQQTLSTEVMFLLLCAAKIKDLPIQRTYSQTDLNKEFISFSSEQHFG